MSKKLGRNDCCSCGSGKKYKKCCLPIERTIMDEVRELDGLSNRIGDLIDENRLDEAEQICFELLQKFPDQSDGLFRLADVYFEKEDFQKAAEYYAKTVVFLNKLNEADPESVSQEMIDYFDEREQLSRSKLLV